LAKALEDFLDILPLDANAGILYGNDEIRDDIAAHHGTHGYMHVASRHGEFDGIREDIEYDLYEPQAIRNNVRQALGDVGRNVDLALGGALGEDGDALVDGALDMPLLEHERKLARLGFGQVEDVVDDVEQVHAGIVDVVRVFHVFL